ncbi:MAG: hypothetical protein K5866_01125 [Treponema sp.]|nr:hypothetical protein [Treponema sp.]
MKQKSFYIYVAAYLAILIPAPGRFVFGLTLLLELIILMFIGIFTNLLIEKLKLQPFKTIVLMFILLSVTVLYRQIFIMFQPEIILTLGFTLYLPTLSLFLIGFLLDEANKSLKENLLYFLKELVFFILAGLIYFLIRDIFGYGTFTFFGAKHHIFEKIILPPEKIGVFSFFATIPGALFLEGIFLYLHFLIKQKFKVISNAEVQK